MAEASKGKGPTRLDQRRKRLREERWSHSASVLWNRTTEKGFVTIPRTLPLIGTLIKDLTKKSDPSRVYHDLWGRVFDQGLVEVKDERQFAMSAGYADGTRNVRSWQERMADLEELGFILTAPSASRKYGFILLLNPHLVVEMRHHDDPGSLPEWWWMLYKERMSEIGAKRPDPDVLRAFLKSL